METVITILTLSTATFVLLLYVLFIRWRMKVHRLRREAQPSPATTVPVPIPRERASTTVTDRPSDQAPESAGGVTDSARVEPEDRLAPHAGPRLISLTEAVEGIVLGPTFAPLIDAHPRPHAIDRAVFSSGMADAGVVRDHVDSVLDAIGYTVAWEGLDATASKGPTVLAVAVVADPTNAAVDGAFAFPGAMLGNVVVDFWIPA